MINDYSASILREIDPDEVSKLMTHKKRNVRKELIKKFLIKSYFNNYKGIENKRELMVVKNLINFVKFLLPFFFLFNFLSYKALLTGVYEYKSFYFNTNKIPFPLRFSFSLYLSYFVFKNILLNYAYNQEVYSMVVNDLKRAKSDTNNLIQTNL